MEMRTLAEGSYGPVEETFVAVARDAETYAALRGLVRGLPELSADHFKANAVVAAFLGTRRSGGYGVSATRAPDGSLRVAEVTPAKDSINTMALTEPFKVVSVPETEGAPLRLELGEAWAAAARAYRVREGQFTQSGGIAGRIEEYRLSGEVRVARLNQLVTCIFDLEGAGTTRPRALRTTATGLARDGAGFQLPRLDSGSLVDHPEGGLRAEGAFANGGGRLTLTFKPLPSNVADGFQGSGKLEAVSAGGR